jgi:hypothetical protein
MSTQFHLHRQGLLDLELDERSARYDLDLDTPDDYRTLFHSMPPEDVLGIALGLIYAVWTSYPDLAYTLITDMHNNLCEARNRQCEQRGYKL